MSEVAIASTTPCGTELARHNLEASKKIVIAASEPFINSAAFFNNIIDSHDFRIAPIVPTYDVVPLNGLLNRLYKQLKGSRLALTPEMAYPFRDNPARLHLGRLTLRELVGWDDESGELYYATRITIYPTVESARNGLTFRRDLDIPTIQLPGQRKPTS